MIQRCQGKILNAPRNEVERLRVFPLAHEASALVSLMRKKPPRRDSSAMSLRMFLERLNGGETIHPNCGWHHPTDHGPE
jgi:hypothetical protein